MIIDKTVNFHQYKHLFPQDLCDQFLQHVQSSTFNVDNETSTVLIPDLVNFRDLRLETVPDDQARFETHRHYIDVQFITGGSEKVAWAPLSSLTPSGPYNAKTDFQFYEPHESGSEFHLVGGMFLIFFPEDGHKPMIHDGVSAFVEKTVFKVHRSVLKSNDS